MDKLKIVDVINEDMKKKKCKYAGRHYYNYKPTHYQGEKVISYYEAGKIHDVRTKEGRFLYTNYFKLMVKQKIDYLLSKEPTISKLPNHTQTQVIDMLESAMLNASLDTTAWLHLYVDDNKLEWIFIPDIEIIPMYDKYNKKIIGIIRYYLIDKDTIKVETWSEKGVKIEIIQKDKLKSTEQLFHYQEEKLKRGKVTESEGKNLPFIPFIPLYNNKDKTSDIEGIQELIDMYNSINSGLVENIDLFQEAIVKLKGFAGNTEELKTIGENMRKYKMVGLPNGGGDNADMEYMAIEIPIEARKVLIDLLKENIFKIGQGLDPDRLAGESNLTNVVIKSRYSGLDMKSNATIKQLKLFYEMFIEYQNIFNGGGTSNEITFNRSQIFNESEQIDNCIKSLNILPLENVLENHPWVTDIKKTMVLLQTEKEEAKKEEEERLQRDLKREQSLNTEDL